MAENTPTSVTIVSNPAIAAQNSLTAINATTQLPLKLTPTNYLTWRAQFNALLIGYDLMPCVDGTLSEPQKTLNNAPNPAYTFWLRQDQLLLHSIIASVSEQIMPLIASTSTSRMAWEKLQSLYANRSRSRVMSLKEKLTATTRGSNSVREFLNTMRSIADELSIIGEPPSDVDLVVHILNGLGPAFKEIAAAIRARDNLISFEDLHDKLVEYENFLNREERRATSPTITAHATYRSTYRTGQSHNRSYNYNRAPPTYRGHQSFSTFNHGNPGSNQPPRKRPGQGYKGFCQLCDQQGHTAKRCFAAIPHFSPAPTANYTANTTAPPKTWLMDSAASHHVTDAINNLSLASPYDGPDSIVIGDGTGLTITHTGHSTLSANSLPYLMFFAFLQSRKICSQSLAFAKLITLLLNFSLLSFW